MMKRFHPDCIDFRIRATGTGMMFWGPFGWGQIAPGLFFSIRGCTEGQLYCLLGPDPDRPSSGVLGGVIRRGGCANCHGR